MQPDNSEKNLVDVFVGKRLRIIRNARDLSTEDLGKLVGVPFQKIQAYEAGTKRITTPMLYKLAKALEIQVTSLFEGVQGYMQLSNYEHNAISEAGSIKEEETREEVMGILMLLQRLPAEKRSVVIQFIETIAQDTKSGETE